MNNRKRRRAETDLGYIFVFAIIFFGFLVYGEFDKLKKQVEQQGRDIAALKGNKMVWKK